MAGSMTGLKLARDLLAGSLSGPQLETNLTTNSDHYLGPWKELLNSKMLSALVLSDTARAAVNASATAAANLVDSQAWRTAVLQSTAAIDEIVTSSVALAAVLNNATARAHMLSDSGFVTALEAEVNDPGSYIVLDEVTATGNWTHPGVDVLAMAVAAAGPGGNGQNSHADYGGDGGTGGELVFEVLDTGDIPSSDVACTVPTTAGSSTTFGALVSAVTGISSDTTPAGSTTNGGASANLTNNDLDASAWHKDSFSQAGPVGGIGGLNANAPETGSAGTAGINGSGGAGGGLAGAGDVIAYGGDPGTGLCSGGGGGALTNGTASGAQAGNAATAPGCGGGGASSSARAGETSETGGAGGPGKIWVWYVKAAS